MTPFPTLPNPDDERSLIDLLKASIAKNQAAYCVAHGIPVDPNLQALIREAEPGEQFLRYGFTEERIEEIEFNEPEDATDEPYFDAPRQEGE